jgi:hypothetical protein
MKSKFNNLTNIILGIEKNLQELSYGLIGYLINFFELN